MIIQQNNKWLIIGNEQKIEEDIYYITLDNWNKLSSLDLSDIFFIITLITRFDGELI